MNAYVTRSQFAQIYGCTKPYVTKLVADKRVVLSTDGKLINVEASMRLLEVTSDPSKAAVRDRWLAYRAVRAPAASASSGSGAGGPACASKAAAIEAGNLAHDESAYHQARTKREQADAELAMLKLKRALTQLIDAPCALRAFVDVQRVARDELRSLADRLAPLVTPETDARKVYDMIQAETERVCEAIGSKIAALQDAGAEPGASPVGLARESTF